MITLTKITDTKIHYGNLILSAVKISDHGSWIMTKIVAAFDLDGTKIVDHHMIGREMPFAKSDLAG